MTGRPPLVRAVAVLGLVLFLAACSSPSGDPVADGSTGDARASVRLPDTSGGFDYQLGGPYPPPSGVTVVERDRTVEPSSAGYDICYVNGFQTQPGESEGFAAAHPDLVVQTSSGPLVDEGWPDEYILDTSTPGKRAALADLVGEWIDECAADGFAAVEIDNLDSYTRSDGALTAENNLDLAATYAQRAHAAGLAIAQKNTADQVSALRALGYDFAVTESCYEFQECAAYTDEYPVVLDIEYTDELGEDGFVDACADPQRPPVMILRDHDLTTPDDADYVYQICP
ncbi:MAG: endo alpha-1,4 polygalactosaminidase [Microbacterium enclense]